MIMGSLADKKTWMPVETWSKKTRGGNMTTKTTLITFHALRSFIHSWKRFSVPPVVVFGDFLTKAQKSQATDDGKQEEAKRDQRQEHWTTENRLSALALVPTECALTCSTLFLCWKITHQCEHQSSSQEVLMNG
mmetsp:Transcript_3851/g.8675  ORF Transcript_3851/g.8675 Transcript_3851/m.8675 type:complete len:134 (+) Transcript_3851:576-977(+)